MAERFRDYIRESKWTYIAIAMGYVAGAYLSTVIPRPQPDERSLLSKLRETQGESALVLFLEGYSEKGWSPVDMNLYIPPAEE